MPAFSGSGAVWAMRTGKFQPEYYPGTAVGVQDALDYCEAGGGGSVFVDSGLNIALTTASIKVPNRVRLIGNSEGNNNPTFTLSAAASLTAIIENKTQDGTQEYCWIERINVNGNKGAGAVSTAGIRFKGVFANSSIIDCVVTQVSGVGIYCEGHTANSQYGPLKLSNLFVLVNGDHNIQIEGPAGSCHLSEITTERPGTGKSCIYIHNTGSSASFNHTLRGIYMESAEATAVGIDLHGCANVSIDGAALNGGTLAALVKIRSTATGSDGAFASSGHVLKNLHGAGATLLVDDQVAGVTLAPAQSNYVQFYVCPLQVGTGGAAAFNGQVVGLQMARKGVDIATASTISPDCGNFFVLTGATTVDNITNALRYSGKEITLKTSGAPTIKHNSGGTGNIRCVGSADVVMSANDIIKFISDGTLWWQSSPVVVI